MGRTVVIFVCLAVVVGAAVGVLDSPSTKPPAGCPDTGPAAVSGLVAGKQLDSSKPAIMASNGDECWHLVIRNDMPTKDLVSIYVTKRAYDAVEVGDSFKRELIGTTK